MVSVTADISVASFRCGAHLATFSFLPGRGKSAHMMENPHGKQFSMPGVNEKPEPHSPSCRIYKQTGGLGDFSQNFSNKTFPVVLFPRFSTQHIPSPESEAQTKVGCRRLSFFVYT